MTTEEAFDVVFKIVVVGDSGVGKTNLLSRFTQNEFQDVSKATIGVEFATKTVDVEGCAIKAQIWDTAGQEKYRAITSVYYRGAAGALLVYDVTNADSFRNLADPEKGWLHELRKNTDEQTSMIIVGNKIDLGPARAVSSTEASDFAAANDILAIETSARDDVNVQEAFESLLRNAYAELKKRKSEETPEVGDEDGQGVENGDIARRTDGYGEGFPDDGRDVVKLDGKKGKKQKKKKCC